jgi:hypothetical protein
MYAGVTERTRSIRWSIKGIHRLFCVRLLVLEGKLSSWLSDKNPTTPQLNLPKKKVLRIVTRLSAQEPDA